MSGGSYDYLCFADADDVLGKIYNLRQMANRLDGLCPEAAAETRALFDGPRSLYAELEARLARLTDLWKAVEWRDSNDWGDQAVEDAIADFIAQGPHPETLSSEMSRVQKINELTSQAARLLNEAERIATRRWMGPTS